VAYAAKAYFSEGIARKIAGLGLGIDVVSLGELKIALKSGFSAASIHLHGNNKSLSELEAAIDCNIQAIVVDSLDELYFLADLAEKKSVAARIWLRINPIINVHTHAHIDTAGANSKFGLPIEDGQAGAAISFAQASRWLNLVGLHAHLGSQLFDPEMYRQAVHKLYRLAESANFTPLEFSPGGGWGVRYTDQDAKDGYETWVKAVSQAVQSECARLGWDLPCLILEPGRSLVTRAGVAVYQVGAQKITASGLHIISVDGGLADNPRHALYQAQYSALVVDQPTANPIGEVRVVGKYCESGDVLIPNIALPEVVRGDLIAIPTSGAYQLSMSSNYRFYSGARFWKIPNGGFCQNKVNLVKFRL
jgi:diaminopimelate decarboxylase